jgi:hypothetical protein
MLTSRTWPYRVLSAAAAPVQSELVDGMKRATVPGLML